MRRSLSIRTPCLTALPHTKKWNLRVTAKDLLDTLFHVNILTSQHEHELGELGSQ